ncbi:MAG: hypothetical protein AB1679_01035 [Actinomycetota bacterium]
MTSNGCDAYCPPTALGTTSGFVRISSELVTGRRLHRAHRPVRTRAVASTG